MVSASFSRNGFCQGQRRRRSQECRRLLELDVLESMVKAALVVDLDVVVVIGCDLLRVVVVRQVVPNLDEVDVVVVVEEVDLEVVKTLRC